MGDLMRRYWHPVAAAAQLEKDRVKAVTHLGESLVLYRDKSGTLGLLAEACVHRRASLAYGMPEEGGLRCAYHGWLYDAQGRCIEQPAEPQDSTFKDRVTIRAYPVQELSGLIFAYLGPQPAPLLPRYDVLVWDDAMRETDGSVIPCNWLQVMENLLDPMHVEALHGRFFRYVLGRKDGDQLQEFLAHFTPNPVKKFSLELFDRGIIQRYMTRTEEDPTWKSGDALFFPTVSLLRSSILFIVPMDDTHTWFLLQIANRLGVSLPPQPHVPFFDVPGAQETGEFIMDTAHGQDHMAVVSQGGTTRRDLESLGRSDTGITLYRRLLKEQMDLLSDGGEPINISRDPAKNESIEIPTGGDASGMGERHEVTVRSG
jgi:5,5'-dehydrodivanillate O-demethylase